MRYSYTQIWVTNEQGSIVDQDKLWQAVLGDIEITLSRGNYLTWFKNTQLLKREGDKLLIGVPNVFIKQQLERKYNELVTATLIKNGVEQPVVEYKIQSIVRRSEAEDPISAPAAPARKAPDNPSLPSQPTLKAANSLAHAYRQGINERYTFENFVVGSGNELAYAACQAIAANPGTI